MPKFVTSLAFSPEFLEQWEFLKEKARLEKKPLGVLVEEILGAWLKAHAKGNPAFPLDSWLQQPTFHAYPALDTDWSNVKPQDFSEKEIQHLEQKARELLTWTRKAQDRWREE